MQIILWIAVSMTLLMATQESNANCTDLSKLSLDNPPTKLSETGIFQDLVTLKPCPSVVEYDVNTAFWSDGAMKRRWIFLPQNSKIQFSPEDPWKFPDGTILVKHFELKSSASKNTSVETRLFMKKTEDDWYGFSYQWQDDQKDAILLDDELTKEYLVFDPAGAGVPRKQSWWFPSQRACQECHNSWSGYVLGARTEQINLTGDGQQKNQLDLWNENKFFSSTIEQASTYKSYARLSDKSQSLEKRAKSYLAANCVQCHQPDSPARSKVDFRFKTPIDAMNLIGQKPNAGDMDIPDAFLVRPGKKETSILWQRMRTSGTQQMPPIGRSETDLSAIELVGTWIDSLAQPPKANAQSHKR